MNHYEITTVASILNDALSKEAEGRSRHTRARKPARARRRFAGKPRQEQA